MKLQMKFIIKLLTNWGRGGKPLLAARQQLSLNWRAVFYIISRSTIFVKNKFMKIFSCKNPISFHKKLLTF